MRTAVRSLFAALTLALASCATPSLAFAEAGDVILLAPADGATGTAVDAARSLPSPAPSVPTEATAGSAAVALHEDPDALTLDALTPPERDSAVPEDVHAVPVPPTSAVVDTWFAKHFHGLGAHLTEYLHGRLLVAIEDLKDLLLELPLS